MEDKEIKEDFENWQEPRKKAKTIIIVLLVLIIIEIFFYFSYFYFYQNTSYFLDEVKDVLEVNIHDVFQKLNIEENNEENNLDIKMFGSINTKYDDNNIAIDFNYYNSKQKFITSIDLDLKQNTEELFKGKMQVQDDKIYYDIPSLSKDILKSNLKELDESEKELNYKVLLLTHPDDLEYLITKLMEYHIEALKEANLTTKIKGINIKEYTIELGALEKNNALRVLKKYIEKDELLSKIIRSYNLKDYYFIPTGKIKINVNTLSGEIISVDVSTNELVFLGRKENDKFIIEDEDYKTYIWFNKDGIKIEDYNLDQLIGKIEYDYKTFNLEYYDNEETGSFKITNDENKIELVLNYKDNDINIKTELNGNKDYLKGNMHVEGIDNYDVDIELKMEVGENLISRIDDNIAKDINTLSDKEINNFYNNILDIFGIDIEGEI